MNYEQHRYILAALDGLRAGKSWSGRTHLQKALYLAQALKVAPVPFEFVLYRHGPYSFEVDFEVDQMISYGAISVIPQAPFGPSLVADKGRAFPDSAVDLDKATLDQVQHLACELGSRGVKELEALATSVWIACQERVNGSDAILARLTKLKPHLDRNTAQDGVDSALKMVASAR